MNLFAFIVIFAQVEAHDIISIFRNVGRNGVHRWRDNSQEEREKMMLLAWSFSPVLLNIIESLYCVYCVCFQLYILHTQLFCYCIRICVGFW